MNQDRLKEAERLAKSPLFYEINALYGALRGAGHTSAAAKGALNCNGAVVCANKMSARFVKGEYGVPTYSLHELENYAMRGISRQPILFDNYAMQILAGKGQILQSIVTELLEENRKLREGGAK